MSRLLFGIYVVEVLFNGMKGQESSPNPVLPLKTNLNDGGHYCLAGFLAQLLMPKVSES